MTQPATSSVPSAPTPGTLAFTKGHGTKNDFVLIADPEGVLDLGGCAQAGRPPQRHRR
jgi:diaminopimelate epimerase